MEEVVGFVFHLEVEVTPSASVGVVAGADGRAVQIGRDKGEADSRRLVETGPDPDGPGVVARTIDADGTIESEIDEADGAPEPDGFDLEHVDPEPISRPKLKAKGLDRPAASGLAYSAPAEDGTVKTAAEPAENPYAGVGRNAPCPCKSGKKYKMCHGRSGG